jgi:molybdopterin/thiamine biosynthesis adenylyltransferase
MTNIDVADLRRKIDLDGRYVDFGVVRTALQVSTVAEDSGVHLSDPSYEGELRGKCPLCLKDKSLAINMNTNRFNCFGKGCALRGGGVIDFFTKLYHVTSKDASHMLACAYGIAPYSSEPLEEKTKAINPRIGGKGVESMPASKEVVTRSEFDDLKARLDRLSGIVWTHMLNNDRPGGIADEYDPPLTRQHVTQ